MNRKTFLRMAGSSLLGVVLPPDPLHTAPAQKAKLSVQLYTIRDAIARDLEGSIEKIAKIGFQYVETAFWPQGTTLRQAAAVLRSAGLKVSSCHVELPMGDQQAIFEATAAAFECSRMIWHGWPEDPRYTTLEGTRELIEVYNQSARHAQSLGLEFGLHNHWWEYRNVVGGKSVQEWLLAECDPSIFFELDTYWIKVAGFEPSDVIRKFGKRAKYLHLKDGPAVYNDRLAIDNPDPMVALGKGTQDMAAILKAQQAEYLVVEMDKVNGDPFEALRESYDYLQQRYHYS